MTVTRLLLAATALTGLCGSIRPRLEALFTQVECTAPASGNKSTIKVTARTPTGEPLSWEPLELRK